MINRGYPTLLKAAKEVMAALEIFGPESVPHLLDNDQNPGQRLREAIALCDKINLDILGESLTMHGMKPKSKRKVAC